MIKGWNEHHVVEFGEFQCMCLAFIERIADQHNFNVVSSEHFHLVDLLFRRDGRHVDHTTNIKVFTGERNTLRMITSTGADDATLALLIAQALNQIKSSPDFIGTYHLKVFAFHVNFSLKLLRQLSVILQRRFYDNSF